ncbi:ribosome maturation factor RimP [Clostridium sardiniense]|uniref:Ribosome maturation factor RimP n=1 Tax=Clostridium sardiniense TaxID=29369 RepID=A0ABS7KXM7_CLOSR|nr:ribosome maturation factor RimP [Clostridium sardiniense]MBY0755575.1 ribosome maturation factor RimP [Clostridium sardiniense]MDQ0460964.1 ribosome maturation factor RimP [Clostridium sardiniense]
MKKDALIEKLEELVMPITDELGYELYHVEFVKEDGENYLRIYIDNEEGITLTDCEKVSRRVSEMLDEEDPISTSYFLELSSPGINRGLFKEEHFKKAVGREVFIRFTGSLNGRKNIKGILKSYEGEFIEVQGEELVKVPMDKIKKANLEGEL